MLAEAAETLGALLLARAGANPDRLLYECLDLQGEPAAKLTYGGLAAMAQGLAARLVREGAAGARVMMVTGPGPDQPVCLFACALAGATAVPLYPPPPDGNASYFDTLAGIAKAAGATLLLCPAAYGEMLHAQIVQRLGAAAPRLLALDMTQLGASAGLTPSIAATDAALLLFTSGSTGTPKGVILTHANLLTNMRAFAAATNRGAGDLVCSWLPHAHVAGLYLRLITVVTGAAAILLPPPAFLARPVLWLQAISRARATISAAPDFAYGLVARAVADADLAGLDLSCWTMAISGGEMVRPATMAAFFNRLAATGLRPDSFHPYYGLTETLCTAVPQQTAPARLDASRQGISLRRIEPPVDEADRSVLIGNGAPFGDTEICAVDPDTGRALPAGQIGELWTRGSGVSPGYFRFDAAQPVDDPSRGRVAGDDRLWFRTGDLGLVHTGQVFVTGRLKDLLIIRGKNHYLQDIEVSAQEAAAGLGPEAGIGAAAAFVVWRDDEEALAIAYEVRDAAAVADALTRAVRRKVAQVHGLAISSLYLLPSGTLPRTATAKVARHACQKLHAAGAWDAYAAALARRREASELAGPDAALAGLQGPALAEALLSRLRLLVAEGEAGAMPPEAVDWPVDELGLSSYDVARIIAALRRLTGQEPPLQPLFDGSSLRQFAAILAAAMQGGAQTSDPAPGWRDDAGTMARALPDARLPVMALNGTVVLTGATGFLGRALLAALLDQGATEIACIVRAPDNDAALRRVEQALAAGPGWKESWRDRITALAGDVTKPALGLDAAAFAALASRAGAILHNAAEVNFVAPYAALAPVNVAPLHDIVRLALTGGVARTLHLVSTLAVFNSTRLREQRRLFGTDRLTEPDHLFSGYARSKWVAEALARIASSRGVPLGIHRPGLIAGDSRTGRAHPDDFLCRFIAGCVELGRAPDAAIELNLVPVDDVARGIAAAVLRPVRALETFHWSCPNPVLVDDFLDVYRARGHRIESEPLHRWLAYVRDELPRDNALYPLHSFLFERPAGSAETILELLDGVPVDVDTTEADAVRAAAGLAATRMTPAVIGRMAQWLEESGFLPVPLVPA
jgi:thioester reductase-like protein